MPCGTGVQIFEMEVNIILFLSVFLHHLRVEFLGSKVVILRSNYKIFMFMKTGSTAQFCLFPFTKLRNLEPFSTHRKSIHVSWSQENGITKNIS